MKRLSFIWFCFRTLESLQFKKSSFSLVPVLYLKTLIVPCQLWSSFVWIIFLQFWLFLSLQGEPILRQLWLHRVLEIGRCQRFGMSAMSRGKYGKKGFFISPKIWCSFQNLSKEWKALNVIESIAEFLEKQSILGLIFPLMSYVTWGLRPSSMKPLSSALQKGTYCQLLIDTAC